MKLIIDVPEKVYQNAREDMLFGSGLITNAIKNGTPIEQYPRIGHWIKLRVGYGCSECTLATNDYGKNLYRYCPNCGCRMSEVSE